MRVHLPLCEIYVTSLGLSEGIASRLEKLPFVAGARHMASRKTDSMSWTSLHARFCLYFMTYDQPSSVRPGDAACAESGRQSLLTESISCSEFLVQKMTMTIISDICL